MFSGRVFKALFLLVALVAVTHSAFALPTYTYCCAQGCRLVLLSDCSYGAWRTQEICRQNCAV